MGTAWRTNAQAGRSAPASSPSHRLEQMMSTARTNALAGTLIRSGENDDLIEALRNGSVAHLALVCLETTEHQSAQAWAPIVGWLVTPSLVPAEEKEQGHPKIPKLTRRQAQMLEYLSADWQPKQIARELGLSLATVRGHIYGAMARLGVHGVPAAACKAQRLGMIPVVSSVSADT